MLAAVACACVFVPVACTPRRHAGAGLASTTAVESEQGLSRGAPPPVDAPVLVPLPGTHDPAPRDFAGIHNAVAFHEGFVSGAAPEGDAGFATLRAMGVRTIISVDGAEPDVPRAAAYGLSYVHLPIGYNGVDEERRRQLARATRDALRAGPVYIHCHHGKHRSAGAAAVVAVSLGWAEPAEAVGRMRVSGTAEAYAGLYACAERATPLAAQDIDAVPADFPSVWTPSGFVRAMVEIDAAHERLRHAQAAGWQTPADHPDLVPAAEAGRLADLYRFIASEGDTARRGDDLPLRLRASGADAQTLEALLADGRADVRALDEQFRIVSASCKDCHARHRD